MNLSLIDPFVLAQDYPEQTDISLRSGHSTSVRFSRNGDFLASGRSDGTIVIFDVETNQKARKLKGHIRPIQSLSWSRDGRYLLSSSQDWRVILWDLNDGSKFRTVRFEVPVYIAEMHPWDHLKFVVSLFDAAPMLVDISNKVPIKQRFSSAPKRMRPDDGVINEKQAAQDAKMKTTVSTFNSQGTYIMTGNDKGWINFIDVGTQETVYSSKVSGGAIIMIRLTASGRHFVINSQDRVIRTIAMPDLSAADFDPDTLQLELEHKFQDVVNRLSWNHVAFSSTGEYVMASTYNNHDVYIWERDHGSLVKILEGPKEEAGVVEWHPHRPLIAACGLETGRIHIWSVTSPQRWSALAPDFAEVEENVEYTEDEDEFDIHPQEEIHKRRLDLEDEPVDVLTMEPTRGDDGDQFPVPVFMDADDSASEEEFIAVGTGTMRRRSPTAGGGYDEEVEASTDDVPRKAGRRSRRR